MRARLLATGTLLGCLGCRSALDADLVSALAADPHATLELDGRGAVATWAAPVDPGRVPGRARQAALAVQPGDSGQWLQERGVHGDGFRLRTTYPTGLRTVLVSSAGEVLHKSWEIPAAEAPAAVRAAAIDAAPGELVRFEILQGTDRDVLYRVTSAGPDRRTRAWTGNALGDGATHILAGAEAWVRTR